jgi:hypothetical protein
MKFLATVLLGGNLLFFNKKLEYQEGTKRQAELNLTERNEKLWKPQ